MCYADFGEQEGTFRLFDRVGQVLFTLFANLVFEGDVTIPRTGWEMNAVLGGTDFLLLRDGRVYGGRPPQPEILATATENIQLANPMRHLVIAAMLGGQCGSIGLP